MDNSNYTNININNHNNYNSNNTTNIHNSNSPSNSDIGISNNNNNINNNDIDDNKNDAYHNDILHIFENIGYELNFYYVPLIVIAGTLGNTLSLIVFLKTKLHKLSSTYYLAALAISDNCYLFSSIIQWLNFWGIHLYNREHFCQFFTFITSLASFCSAWFVVAFTIERFIAVIYPLKRPLVCTVSRAKCVLLCISIFGILHCTPFWLFSKSAYSTKAKATFCDIRNEYKDYITLHNYWDTMIVYVAPSILITILNSFTGYTVWKFATVRHNLTKSKKKSEQVETNLSMCAIIKSNNSIEDIKRYPHKLSDSIIAADTTTINTITTDVTLTSSIKIGKSHKKQQQNHQQETQFLRINFMHNDNENDGQQNEPKMLVQKCATFIPSSSTSISANDSKPYPTTTNASELKITKMLLLVSTVFVCLNLPSCILRITAFIESQSSLSTPPSPLKTRITSVLQYMFHLLLVTNFGINFVLYCISGQNFRKSLLNMFGKGSKIRMEPIPQVTDSDTLRTAGGGGSGSVSFSGVSRTITGCNNSINSISYLTNDGINFMSKNNAHSNSIANANANGNNTCHNNDVATSTYWNEVHELYVIK